MGGAPSSGEEVAVPPTPRLSIVGPRKPCKSRLQDALTHGLVTESPWEMLAEELVAPAEKATVKYRGLTVEDVPQEYGDATAEEYIEKFGLAQANCVVFAYTGALGEALGRCAELLVGHSQQERTDPRGPAQRVLLVKSNIDSGGEGDVAGLDTMRGEAYDELSVMGLQHLANDTHVFLFGGDLQQALEAEGTSPWQQEWRRLKQAVFEKMPSAVEQSSDHGGDFSGWKDSLVEALMPMMDITLPSEAVEDEHLASFVQRTKAECEERRVPTLSIVGSRGVGKTTILNSLRGLGPRDPGARPVGAKECTLGQVEPIEHCGLLLRDVPGADGSLVRATMGEEYIREFELDKSDGILFIYTTVFSKAHGACAKILREVHKKPVFFVRNKVDEDCKNDVNDGNYRTHQAAFDSIRQRTLEEMQREGLTMFADEQHIFLISARIEETTTSPALEPWQADWWRLEQAVFTSIQDEAKRCIVRAILNGNARELADLRRQECEDLASNANPGNEEETPRLMNPFRRSVVLGKLLVMFVRIFALNVTRADDPLRESKSLVARKVLERTVHYSFEAGACNICSVFAVGSFGILANVAAVAQYDILRDYHRRSFAQEVIPKLASIAQEFYLAELREEVSAADRTKSRIRDVSGLNSVICEVFGAEAAGPEEQAPK